MKKWTCLLLVVVMLMALLVGCKPKDPLAKLSGTEAAKLLLAEERLNAQLLKNEGDLFENGVEVMQNLAQLAIDNLQASTPEGIKVTRLSSGSSSRAITLSGSFGDEKTDIGKMEIQGDTVVWSDFGEVSNSYEYFLNLTNNIVLSAEIAADMIDFVKKNIRIVDKFVRFGQDKYYLHVSENEELLCRYDEYNKILDICRRYRDASGRDVYELYRDNGSGHTERMTYIPGVRYELTMDDEQFFSASNTKGYWEVYVLGNTPSHFNVSYLIMKDNICYQVGFSPELNKVGAPQIISADRQTDLMWVDRSPNAMAVILKLNGFDGVTKIIAPKSECTLGEDWAAVSGSEKVLLHAANGKTLAAYDRVADGAGVVSGILVSAGVYGYDAEIDLRFELAEGQNGYAQIKAFLQEYGLVCRRDIDSVLAGVDRAYAEIDSLVHCFAWNGIVVNSEENIRKAIAVEKSRCEAMLAYYTDLKNVETVDFDNAEVAALNMYFATIAKLTAEKTSANGTAVEIQNITLQVDDTLLFVENEPYTVMLALADSKGGLIHLEQTGSAGVAYTGGKSFTVTAANISLELPILAAGTYRLVAYIATSDGIRSSGYAAVPFTGATELSVDLGTCRLTGELSADSTLVLTYGETRDKSVMLTGEGDMDYAKFCTLVREAVFTYGIPGETVEKMEDDESFTPLIGTETEIPDGIYRMAYTVENGTAMESGYVYIDFTTDF